MVNHFMQRKSKSSGGVPSKRSKGGPSTPKGSKSKRPPSSTPKQGKSSGGSVAPNTPTPSADLDTSSVCTYCAKDVCSHFPSSSLSTPLVTTDIRCFWSQQKISARDIGLVELGNEKVRGIVSVCA